MRKVRRSNLLLVLAMAFVAMFSCFFGVATLKDNVQVSAETTIDYTNLLGLEDRTSWGAHEGEYYFGGVTLSPFSYFNTAASVSGTWHTDNPAIILANNGVDIMEYIYVNGQSARKLITENANGERAKNSCSCWLSNPAAYPVYVETTNGSGIIIRVSTAFFGNEVTITFKPGFSLIRNDGAVITISEDITYVCKNSVLAKVQQYTLSFVDANNNVISTKKLISGEAIGTLPEIPAKGDVEGYWTIDGVKITEDTVWTYGENKTATPVYEQLYRLSFEGISDTIEVRNGYAIGELPAVPTNDGYWTIDGVMITANTVWTYGGNKTAVAVYAKDVTDIFGLEDRAWGAHEGEYYFGGINLSGGYFNTAASVSTCWYAGNTAPISANNGVDIMEYIYVNGVSARQLIEENAGGNRLSNSCNCWLSNPAAYPVYVETTTGSGIIMRIAKAHVGESFTIVFKAGFSIIDVNDDVCVLKDDVKITYANGVLTRVVIKEYVLSFEGISDSIGVYVDEKIGALPAIPEVEGKLPLYWAIDGVEITADTVWTYGENKTAKPVYADKYVLSFEGMSDTLTVVAGEAIGELPAIPAKDGYVGFWAIDGKVINEKSVIAEDKKATIVYAIEYDSMLGLEDRAWGAHEGEYYFGGINLPEGWFNTTASVNGAWHTDNPAIIAANNGVDIMEYIYVNGVSARKLITDNANGEKLSNACGCWLSNPAAYPVYVETTVDSGLIIRIAKAYAGESFTITFKAGFSLIRNDDQLVYVSNDINYSFANGTLKDELRFSVSFDGANPQYVRKGGTIVAPADPTKEATESHTYVFDAWYNGETKWDFNAPVESAMNLVAKFNSVEKAKFEVTFNADNGTENTTVSVYVGAVVKAEQIPEAPVKTVEGNTAYTFLYWSLDGENAYDFATPVTGAITLKAIYTTKPLYTVTMGDVTTKVVEGGKVEKPADPTKDATAEFSYTFDAWYNGETKWDFDNDVVTTDVELTAKFIETKRSYTITFNVTGNEAVSFESVTVEYGTSYDLSTLLEGVDVSAYKYTVTVNGEAVTSFEVLSDVTVDVTFVARVYYTVSIDGVEQTVEEGEKAVMPETEPTKAATAEFNYTFDGWYNGETKWDFDTVVTGDLVLTAQFIEAKRTYTITFNVTGNDSIALAPVTVEYGEIYDLSNLLEGKDVSGYSYSISVGGVEKISFKVIADTTVDVAFTAKPVANDKQSNGCAGTIGGASAMICAMALGVAVALKKKED